MDSDENKLDLRDMDTYTEYTNDRDQTSAPYDDTVNITNSKTLYEVAGQMSKADVLVSKKETTAVIMERRDCDVANVNKTECTSFISNLDETPSSIVSDCENLHSCIPSTCGSVMQIQNLANIQFNLHEAFGDDHLSSQNEEKHEMEDIGSKNISCDATTVSISLSNTDLYKSNPDFACSTISDSFEVDENTTQLRFMESDVGFGNEDGIGSSSTGNNIDHNSVELNKHSEFDLFNQLFHNLPTSSNLTSMKADSVSQDLVSAKTLDKSQADGASASVSPSLSEECSLDSGVISMDERSVPSTVYGSDTGATLRAKAENFEMKLLLSETDVDLSNSTSTNVTSVLTRKRSFSCISGSNTDEKQNKKSNETKAVSFKGVTVYHFQRKQGFITVPSQGGSTLGMSLKHNQCSEMTLKQHNCLIAHRRKLSIKEQKRQQRIDTHIEQLKERYPNWDNTQLVSMALEVESAEDESTELPPSDECFDNNNTCDTDHTLDDEDDYFFLQAIPAKKRRLMLRMAGVQRIDPEEKYSNRITRESREVCGCDCEGVCDPVHCQCAAFGVPCQVDRESFPCGCVASGCHNPSGRVEFDADRVKNHYIHTMRKLRMEETGAKELISVPRSSPPQPHKSPYVLSVLDANSDDVLDNYNSNTSVTTSAETDSLQDSQLTPPAVSFSNLNSPLPDQSWNARSFHCNDNFCQLPIAGTSASLESDGNLNIFQNTYRSNVEYNSQITTSPKQKFDFTSTEAVSAQNTSGYFVTQSGITSNATSQPFGAYYVSSDSNTAATFTDVHCILSRCMVANSEDYVSFPQTNFKHGKQTHRLDPIATLLPSITLSGRHANLENNVALDSSQSHNQARVISQDSNEFSSNYNLAYPPGEDRFEYANEQSNWSRSPSLSECSHDASVDVKA